MSEELMEMLVLQGEINMRCGTMAGVNRQMALDIMDSIMKSPLVKDKYKEAYKAIDSESRETLHQMGKDA